LHDRVVGVASVANGHVLQREHRVGQRARVGELETEIALSQHGRKSLHALERLEAALRLAGFGGFGAKAIDEALQVRDALLLAQVGRLLLLPLLGPHLLEARVRGAVARQASLLQVQGDAGDGIEQFPVVADHHQRAGVALQPPLQPNHGVQIQVVGGFVEQQQVARAHQGPRQL
jgi:hypothetical protein